MLVAEDRCRAVRAVDVHPELVFAAQLADRGKVIEGYRVRGACGRDDAERNSPGRGVLFDCSLQTIYFHLDASIHYDAPNVLASESEESCRFIQRVMSFVGCIYNRSTGERLHA